jgi:hypothetical protein
LRFLQTELCSTGGQGYLRGIHMRTMHTENIKKERKEDDRMISSGVKQQ